MKKFIISILISSVILSISTLSWAQDYSELQKINAQNLVTLKIMKGFNDGSLGLNNSITRAEFCALLTRLAGYENETVTTSTSINFKDLKVKHWAFKNIIIALKYKIIAGYPDNTIGLDKNVTFAEALTMVSKTLGYQIPTDKAWPINILELSKTLNLTKNLDFEASKKLTRGDVSILLCNALETPISSSSSLLGAK